MILDDFGVAEKKRIRFVWFLEKAEHKFCVVFRKNRTLLSHLCRTKKTRKKLKHLRSNFLANKNHQLVLGSEASQWRCGFSVDGRNPVEHQLRLAVKIPLFTGFDTSQVVWDL